VKPGDIIQFTSKYTVTVYEDVSGYFSFELDVSTPVMFLEYDDDLMCVLIPGHGTGKVMREHNYKIIA
jgi:hypothetical protein